MIYPQYGYPSYYPQAQNLYSAPQQPVQQQIRSGGIVSVANEAQHAIRKAITALNQE